MPLEKSHGQTVRLDEGAACADEPGIDITAG